MKIIILVLSLILLISLHVFADTYTVTLDGEQAVVLMQRADEVSMLPDEFVQELVVGYVDGMIDEKIQAEFDQLTKHEQQTMIREYFEKNRRNVVNGEKENKK